MKSNVAAALHIIGILGLIGSVLFGFAGCNEYGSFRGEEVGAAMMLQAVQLALGSLLFIGLARVITLLELLVIETSTFYQDPPPEDTDSELN